jgi:hypothetical protein
MVRIVPGCIEEGIELRMLADLLILEKVSALSRIPPFQELGALNQTESVGQ